MTDIVERLRATRRAEIPARASLWEEAADEIERLREALRPFAERAAAYDPPQGDDNEPAWCHSTRPTIGDLRRARAVVGEGK